MADQVLPKLTPAQCVLVEEWVSSRLRSWVDTWEDFARPGLADILAEYGAVMNDASVPALAESTVVRVGGSHGDTSWKESPRYVDIDVFFLLPADTVLSLTIAKQVYGVMRRRLTDEIDKQTDRCTIEGVALEQNGVFYRLDRPKLGMLYNGVIWSVPSRCHHCGTFFADARFCVNNGIITHESCLGA